MPKMSQRRKRRLIRNPDGTFKEWIGGADLKDLPKQKNNYQGIAIHIGKEFKKQRGRTARVGDTVRTKTDSGRYHKQAEFYIKTPNGWRKSPTGTTKPTKAQIQRVIRNSRKGRR